ncbi:MAG: hypothetical protein HYX90_09480 [Chloroflexi bacterium]|nr:hypothetical protein [Chloroflexota bacterium]
MTPLKDNLDKIVDGLTRWLPTSEATRPSEMVTVQATGHDEAVAKMNALFLRNRWGDGLPIVPPTEERVRRILEGTDLPASTAIGKILPQGRIATVETLAIGLAMAGGRPEYLPVLIAAIQAILDPRVMHQAFNATTCSNYPAMIVNGPVGKQIRLNSGYGCLGPSPDYPAGASIGRAVRLLLMNVGGAIPGTGSMAIFGGANRYTNIIFAEDEEGLPPGWEPLNTSYFGYKAGTNTVAIHPVGGTVNILETSVSSPETVLSTLHTLAGVMGVPTWNYWHVAERFRGAPGVLIMARGTVQGLARLGWTRQKVQEFLWEHSKVPWSMIEKACPPHKLQSRIDAHEGYLSAKQPWPITARPENIMIAVAGGAQSGHGYWMQVGNSFRPACRQILPSQRWDELLMKAERDLGQTK